MHSSDPFHGKASVYSRFRPNYPQTMIHDLIRHNKLEESSLVADIGAGTGILTGQLLQAGLRVAAIEPNDDMRRIAEAAFSANPHFTAIAASAEQTSLGSGSVDFITVAQAFHWFNPEYFRNEARRILKPGGNVALIWNSRLPDAALIRESETICRQFCPDFRGFSGGTGSDPAVFHSFFKNGQYRLHVYDHPLAYNREQFIGRHLSASYAPRAADGNYRPFVKALTQLFDKYEQNGRVIFPNVTRCYCGKV